MEIEAAPIWKYEIPLEQFRKLDSAHISELRVKYVQTGADTAESFMEARGDGVSWIRLHPKIWSLFEFDPNGWNTLVRLTYEGQRAKMLSDQIREYNRKKGIWILTNT